MLSKPVATVSVTSMDIDNLDDFEEVEPRSIWSNEARDFTPWIAANLDRLSKILPFELQLVEIEAQLSSGFADITAQVTDSQTKVIIENQLEETDDDHLARLLTYAASYDAQIIIWISTKFTERIRQTLNWLNRNAGNNPAFYGIRLRVLKTAESRHAPLFDIVVEPTGSERLRSQNAGIAPDDNRYKRFFQTIVDELSRRDVFKYETVRSKKSWFEFNTNLDGITYVVAFTTRSTARAELHVRCWKGSNHQAYEDLLHRKREIENELSEPLKWEQRDRHYGHWHLIALYKPGSIDSPEDELSELSTWMVEKLAKLKQVFDPYLDKIM